MRWVVSCLEKEDNQAGVAMEVAGVRVVKLVEFNG